MLLNNYSSKEELIKDMNEKEECPHHYDLKSLDSCEDGVNIDQCLLCWSDAINQLEQKNIMIFENEGLQVLGALAQTEEHYKLLSQQRDELKEKLLNMMKTYNINKFENDFISITYIPESKRESFNNKDFKIDYPDLHKKYLKFSEVKDSVRFKIK